MTTFVEFYSSRRTRIVSSPKVRMLSLIRILDKGNFEVVINYGKEEEERKLFFPKIFFHSCEQSTSNSKRRLGDPVLVQKEINLKRVGEVSRYLSSLEVTYNAAIIAKRKRILHNMEKRKIIHDSRINIEGGKNRKTKRTSYQQSVFLRKVDKIARDWNGFEKTLQFNESMKGILRISSPQIKRRGGGISLNETSPQYYYDPPDEKKLRMMRDDIKKVRRIIDGKAKLQTPWTVQKDEMNRGFTPSPLLTRKRKKKGNKKKKKKNDTKKGKGIKKKKNKKKKKEEGIVLPVQPLIVSIKIPSGIPMKSRY